MITGPTSKYREYLISTTCTTVKIRRKYTDLWSLFQFFHSFLRAQSLDVSVSGILIMSPINQAARQVKNHSLHQKLLSSIKSGKSIIYPAPCTNASAPMSIPNSFLRGSMVLNISIQNTRLKIGIHSIIHNTRIAFSQLSFVE